MGHTKLSFLSAQALTASNTSDIKIEDHYIESIKALIIVPTRHADTALAAKIQHSPDGLNWFDYCTFTPMIAGSGAQSEVIHINDGSIHNFQFLRSVVTLSGANTTATVTLELHYTIDEQ